MISSRQFEEWKLFDLYVEPIGRNYEQTSKIIAAIFAAFGGAKLFDWRRWLPTKKRRPSRREQELIDRR